MPDEKSDESAKKKADEEAKAKEAEEAKAAAAAKKKADEEAHLSQPIDKPLREELLDRARLAGATDNSLAELSKALEKATVDDLPEFTDQIAKLRKKNRKTYHVVSEGSVLHDGERYEHGENLLLTEAEAADLGSGIVAGGNAPPAPVVVGVRKAGKYRVAEERNVMHAGKFHGPGTILELSQEDARSIGDYVVEA